MEVGGWRRGRILGRGASATVSLATSVASGRIFAVKSSELSRSASLRWEQRLLSSMDSPFVVSCFGSGDGRLQFDLFLEYAPGGSLADEIERRGGRLDERAIRSCTHDILRGLAYLHSNGVVHCDLKSQNVLICSGGRAKIGDLGCARLAGERGCRMRGTPVFMAPEVARGEEQGALADVWALGCTVVEMATGRPPWPHAADAVSALHRIAFSADVPELPSWISGEGKDFLSWCLRRDPDERWTAEQLLQHPFVAHSKSQQPPEPRWISPKSTLDQALWEFLSDDEEELGDDDEQPPEDASERIQSLIGGGGPNWTREDDSWVEVRSGGGECGSLPANRDGAELELDSGGTSTSEKLTSRSDIEHASDSRLSNRCRPECGCCSAVEAGIVAELDERSMEAQLRLGCKRQVNSVNERFYFARSHYERQRLSPNAIYSSRSRKKRTLTSQEISKEDIIRRCKCRPSTWFL